MKNCTKTEDGRWALHADDTRTRAAAPAIIIMDQICAASAFHHILFDESVRGILGCIRPFCRTKLQIKFCYTRKRRNGFMSYELNIAQCLSLHWMKIKAYASIHYAIPGHSYFYCLSYCLHLLCITHKICIWRRRQQYSSPTPDTQRTKSRETNFWRTATKQKTPRSGTWTEFRAKRIRFVPIPTQIILKIIR